MCVSLCFVVELFLMCVCISVLVAAVPGGDRNPAFGLQSSVSVGCSERFLLAFLSFVGLRAGIVLSLRVFVCVCFFVLLWWSCFEVGLYLCFDWCCAGRSKQHSFWSSEFSIGRMIRTFSSYLSLLCWFEGWGRVLSPSFCVCFFVLLWWSCF